MDREKLIEIGMTVTGEAEFIFEVCNAKDDFCIQDSSGMTIVFGGTNRLLFSPRLGFRPDASYCTKRFLELFEKYFGDDRKGVNNND